MHHYVMQYIKDKAFLQHMFKNQYDTTTNSNTAHIRHRLNSNEHIRPSAKHVLHFENHSYELSWGLFLAGEAR